MESHCELLDEICKNSPDNKLIIGDFNLANTDWSTWTAKCNLDTIDSKFLECLRDNLLLQHVNKATRARGTDNPHLLDLVISDDEYIDAVNYLSPLGKSDHSVLNFTCKLACFRVTHDSKLNYNKGDYEGLRKFMDRDWETELDQHSNNVNSVWESFKLILWERLIN